MTRNLHLKRCDYAVRAGIQVRLTQTDSHFRTKAVPLDSQLMLQKRAATKQNTVQCTLCSTKLLYNYYWSNTWMASQLHGSRVRGSILRVCVFHMFSLRVFSGFAGFLQPHKKPKLFLSLSLFFFFSLAILAKLRNQQQRLAVKFCRGEAENDGSYFLSHP